MALAPWIHGEAEPHVTAPWQAMPGVRPARAAMWRAHREAQHQGLRWQALLGPMACLKVLWRVHPDAGLLARRAWLAAAASLAMGCSWGRVAEGWGSSSCRVRVPYGPMRPRGSSSQGGGSCADRGSEQAHAGLRKACGDLSAPVSAPARTCVAGPCWGGGGACRSLWHTRPKLCLCQT